MFAGIADVARWLSQTLCFVFVGSLSRSFNLCWMRFVLNFLCRCAGLFCNASEFWQITNHFSFNFASSTGFIRLFLFSSFIFCIKKMWWKYFWKRKQRIACHKWLDFANANHISCQLMYASATKSIRGDKCSVNIFSMASTKNHLWFAKSTPRLLILSTTGCAWMQSKFKPMTNSLNKNCLQMKKTLFWI